MTVNGLTINNSKTLKIYFITERSTIRINVFTFQNKADYYIKRWISDILKDNIPIMMRNPRRDLLKIMNSRYEQAHA